MSSPFLFVTLLLLAAWLAVFVGKRELRLEMLLLSVCAVLLTPVIITVHGGDPLLVAERFAGVRLMDLLFSWSVAGLAGTVYHAVFGKHYHRLPKIPRRKAEEGILVQIWLIRLFIGTIIFLWGIVFFVFALPLTPAQAALVTATIMTVYIVAHRHDLLADATLSALLMGAVTFIAGSIALFLSPSDITSNLLADSGRIGHIPTDLLTWSVAFGLALGPLYEYIRRVAIR